MCSGSKEGLYLRVIDSCITQLKGQKPSRTFTKSKEEEEKKYQPRSEVAADLKGHKDDAVLRCPQPSLPPGFEFRMRELEIQCKDLVVLIIDRKTCYLPNSWGMWNFNTSKGDAISN